MKKIGLEQIGPRERLVAKGASSLADYELVAIILRTGSREEDVLSVAKKLCQRFNGLFDMQQASIVELQETCGVGLVKAVELKAAQELGQRLHLATQLKLGQVTSSEGLGRLLITELKHCQQEHLMVFYLNNRHEMIKKELLFLGSLTESVAHPREIFSLAVKCHAAKIVLGHNHPSGNLLPSKSDKDFTSRMVTCGDLLGIPVLDHVIVSSEGYYSFKEHGLIK